MQIGPIVLQSTVRFQQFPNQPPSQPGSGWVRDDLAGDRCPKQAAFKGANKALHPGLGMRPLWLRVGYPPGRPIDISCQSINRLSHPPPRHAQLNRAVRSAHIGGAAGAPRCLSTTCASSRRILRYCTATSAGKRRAAPTSVATVATAAGTAGTSGQCRRVAAAGTRVDGAGRRRRRDTEPVSRLFRPECNLLVHSARWGCVGAPDIFTLIGGTFGRGRGLAPREIKNKF